MLSRDRFPWFWGAVGGEWGRGVHANQMQFATVEQFPLDLVARLQADGGGQREGEIDVEARLLSLGTDGLDFERIFCLHSMKLAYRLTLDVGLRRPVVGRRSTARREQ